MAPRTHFRLAVLLAVALVALHLDFWRPQRPLLLFGWLPEELAWRLAWMAAAFVYLLYFCTYAWRTED